MHRTFISRAMMGGAAMLALSACSVKEAVDTGKLGEAIKGDVHQLAAAYNARDAARAVAFDAPDYVGMFHGGPTTAGPAADLAAMKAQMMDPAMRFDLSDEKVDVAASGEFAVYRATYAYRYTDPVTRRVMIERGNWVAAFRRQGDGSMKLVWAMGADSGAATVAPVT